MKLPRSAPEAQGVTSSALLAFLQAARGVHELHSVCLLRHGHVIAEGWSAPYRADAIHSLNSVSKSFTATAVAMAVAEDRLALSDRVISFFPGETPRSISANLAALTVEHLLTLSTGHVTDPTPLMVREQDWIRAFFDCPIEQTPGSVFSYNSAATYILSAIVQHVCGRKLVDYLDMRLFAPLGIEQKHWDSCPHDINTGGWGLSLTTESLAKFGQLYLQQGSWHGRQLLSSQWIAAASSCRIRQVADDESQPDSDWNQGYGYHFWPCRYGAYRADGAFGQFCIVMPAQDAVLALTSRTMDLQGLLNQVWQYLPPGMCDAALPADHVEETRLRSELQSMALQPPLNRVAVAATERRFDLQPNDLGAARATLRFDDASCVLTLESDRLHADIRCGIGRWIDGLVNIPDALPRFITRSDRRPVKVAASAAWIDANTLQMHWRYYETPHHEVVTCHFEDERVRIEFRSDCTGTFEGYVSGDRPDLRGFMRHTPR
jgi:CubicO group peptidase (beta-lactamase class C family)